MTRTVTGIAVAFVTGAFAASSASAALLGHWTFEGDATNSGTLGAINDGTIHGGVSFVAGPTGFGQAAHFDGSTGYIRVNNSESGPLDLVNSSYTMAVWAKGDVNKVGRFIVKDDGADFSGGYSLFVPAGDDWRITHLPAGNLGPVPVPVDATEWFHFAVRYDVSTQVWDYFVNGAQVATANNVAPLASDGNDPLRFGAGAFNVIQGQFTFQGYAGALDDIRIYDEALSNDAIAALTIPEPASLALIGIGAAACLFRTRR